MSTPAGALGAWEDACTAAHGGSAVITPLLTAARLMEAGDQLKAIIRDSAPPRAWLYGLTADQWLHLASEGEASEVGPCCGNTGLIRDLLNALATEQDAEGPGLRWSLGRQLLNAVETDGSGHDLDDDKAFPLLHQVLKGVAAELRARDERYGNPS